MPYFQAKLEDTSSAVDQKFTQVFNLAKEKLFAKHELPKIQGRRANAIRVLKVIADELPVTKNYCEDIVTIIKTLDDLSEGALKDIAQLDLRNIEQAHKLLLETVPESYIRNVLTRANRTENEHELLLFAEQFV